MIMSLTITFVPDMRTPNCETTMTSCRFIDFQMHGMMKTLLFALAVTCIASSLSKQDCARCCLGKWTACFTGCTTLKECDSQCNTQREICQKGCPGSCSVKDPPSFRKRSLISGNRSTNGPKKLKMKWKLLKNL